MRWFLRQYDPRFISNPYRNRGRAKLGANPLARYHQDAGACVDAVIRQVGKKIVLGLPLGLGKANHFANALYQRAAADPSIDLHIFTALTLEKTPIGPAVLRRFVAPIVDRLFGGYPDLLYAKASRDGTLPANITVSEFYVAAGQRLHSPSAQQSYVSANYTDVPRLLLDLGINVVAQLVARRDGDGSAEYSLSCNPDITLDLMPELRRQRLSGTPIAIVGEVSDELPFMLGDAVLPEADFDQVLDGPELRFPLFAPPKESVSLAQFAIGIRIAALIKDGGSLQIGIGALADALAWSVILRHRNNAAFREIAGQLGIADEARLNSNLASFEEGLYGVSEMFVDVFLDLYRAGILKRRAEDGALLHAAFFLGPQAFYRALREMPEAERQAFQMKPISFTNALSGFDSAARQATRRHARFVNEGMTATLLGEIASDTLDNGQVVSGVGGQYNFVAQAHELADARSIIAINATRTSSGRTTSNIRWTAGHVTIPRHLRDIVVTEFGIADLRGKSDRDCVAAMLRIADSRFQAELLQAAITAGKIEQGYTIPAAFRRNSQASLEAKLQSARRAGLLPAYPFGTDLDATEQRLAAALENLKRVQGGRIALASRLFRSMFAGRSRNADQALQRVGLLPPASLSDRVLARLLNAELLELEKEAARRIL